MSLIYTCELFFWNNFLEARNVILSRPLLCTKTSLSSCSKYIIGIHEQEAYILQYISFIYLISNESCRPQKLIIIIKDQSSQSTSQCTFFKNLHVWKLLFPSNIECDVIHLKQSSGRIRDWDIWFLTIRMFYVVNHPYKWQVSVFTWFYDAHYQINLLISFFPKVLLLSEENQYFILELRCMCCLSKSVQSTLLVWMKATKAV